MYVYASVTQSKAASASRLWMNLVSHPVIPSSKDEHPLLQEDSSVPVTDDGNTATQDSESLGSDTSDEEGDADAERSFGVRSGEAAKRNTKLLFVCLAYGSILLAICSKCLLTTGVKFCNLESMIGVACPCNMSLSAKR